MNLDLKRILKNYKLNEENISMIFGGIVIIVLGILIVNYFKDNDPQIIPANSTEVAQTDSTYTVQKGDSLWKVSEEKLGDGFKWEELKKENNLTSDVLVEGQTLKIPSEISVLPKPAITTDTYTVVAGDTLWGIAEKAYGTGFDWTKIASENKLANPSIIHAGNVLKLPR